MKLTLVSRSPNQDEFPTLQLFFLAICRLAEPIALTSIFPYAWLMVQSFHIGNKDDASFYAGVLISAFSLAEAASGMFWGSLSDRVGRKPILLLGCCGTMISLLIVGFSKSFTMALFGRFLGGALNGNIGVIQTMVGELVKNPAHEVRANAIIPFVWSIGTIVGPALSGTLADPVRNFPSVFPEGGLFDEYPWALPNIVCAAIMLFSIVLSFAFLEETHPDLRKDADPDVFADFDEITPIITAGSTTNPSVDLRQDNYGTFNEVEISNHDEWRIAPGNTGQSPIINEKHVAKWLTWRVGMLVAALGIYTYHSMCYDHLLPIFLQDKRREQFSMLSSNSAFHLQGGLGLKTKTVGLIMSINGVIALFIQAVVFPFLADRLGLFRTFMMVTVLHPVAFFIVPYLILLPENLLFPGIYTCLAIRQFLSILDYPVLLIMLKQASSSPRYLGKINGLAASVGAACRMIAPPIAGLLYDAGKKIQFSGLAWYGAGIVALVGVAQMFAVGRERNSEVVVRSLASGLTGKEEHHLPRDVVDVIVVEAEEDVERQA